MTSIYVGNLSYQTTSDDLQEAFSQFGQVAKANVITDRDSGQSKGFGFVEMSDSTEAQSAIEALNERPLGGRNIKVNEARPKSERPKRW
ncbi:MAG: RNA-binding protein [Planctomycetaceae bacterium]|nr:RNA-binding protein [Planctomycetaceae bacterium]